MSKNNEYKNFYTNNKNGIALYFVLFILIVLGILSIQLFQVAKHSGAIALRLQGSEIARRLAEIACNETAMIVWNESNNPSSPIFKWLFTHSKSQDFNAIDIPITKKLLSSLPLGFKGDVKVTLKIVDFFSSERSKGYLFYPGEGLGTFQIETTVTLTRGKDSRKVSLIRHHDYKISCLLSSRINRHQNVYSPSSLLDYVLFIRKAGEEFKNPPRYASIGSAYHSNRLKIVIEDQDTLPETKRGKIGFGHIYPNSHIFFNISPNLGGSSNQNSIAHSMLPIVPNLVVKEIDVDGCGKLFKEIAKNKRYLKDLKGIFKAETWPIFPSNEVFPGNHFKMAQEAVVSAFSENHLKTTEPSIFSFARNPNLLLDSQYMDSILEGPIRQRFFYLVKFTFDYSKVDRSQIPPQDLQELTILEQQLGDLYGTPGNPQNQSQQSNNKVLGADNKKELICIPRNPDLDTANDVIKQFVKGLEELDKTSPDFPLIMRFDDSFLYKRASENYSRKVEAEKRSFKAPAMHFDKAGTAVLPDKNDLMPFDFFPLYFRFVQRPSDLIPTIIDPDSGTISLRGIIRIPPKGIVQDCGGPLILQSSKGLLEFIGKGVFVADEGVFIKSSIKKSSRASNDDFLIIFSKGPIVIETNDEIEAGLIALGQNGYIIPKKNLKLFGAMIVEKLMPDQWCDGEHSIRYNPVFSPDKDIYQIVTSPQIAFQRVIEN